MLYYVYNKNTGEFAGSGQYAINDDTYASTTTEPPASPFVEPTLVYDEATDQWSWVEL